MIAVASYFSESVVFTPNQKDAKLKKAWLLAKGFVEVVDMVICQVKCHLLDTHITQEVFCNLFRRHFSSRHPLFELFESHCEGTTPVGALGITSLIDEYRYLHRLFHIGHTGTRKLINLFYQKQHYDDSDFNMLLEVRAVFNQLSHNSIIVLLHRCDADDIAAWEALLNF